MQLSHREGGHRGFSPSCGFLPPPHLVPQSEGKNAKISHFLHLVLPETHFALSMPPMHTQNVPVLPLEIWSTLSTNLVITCSRPVKEGITDILIILSVILFCLGCALYTLQDCAPNTQIVFLSKG